MAKGTGILPAITGAICTTIGIAKSCSWKYKIATGLGVAVPEVQAILYCGIAFLVIGIICPIISQKKSQNVEMSKVRHDTPNRKQYAFLFRTESVLFLSLYENACTTASTGDAVHCSTYAWLPAACTAVGYRAPLAERIQAVQCLLLRE